MMKPKNEWPSWAKQFEAHTIEEYTGGALKKIKQPARCLFPEIEGPHKVACRDTATHRSPDNYPTCVFHRNIKIRAEWRGYIRGA